MEHSYKAGDEVEVMLEGEGFENSYFAGTIVSKEGPKNYKFEYATLLKDDCSGPLVEVLPAHQIRPKPPHVPVTCFSLYERADVYEDDGWWAGIIYGKFASEYFLYHPATQEEKPYTLDRLRAHQEWKDGRWICHKVGV